MWGLLFGPTVILAYIGPNVNFSLQIVLFVKAFILSMEHYFQSSWSQEETSLAAAAEMADHGVATGESWKQIM